MAFSESIHFALILSLLTARAVTQLPPPPVAISSNYFCPLATSSSLTACASYASSFDVTCAPLATASKTAAYLSCYCGSALFSLESLCYAELASCAGIAASTVPYLGNSVCSGGLGSFSSSGPVTITSTGSDGSVSSSTSLTTPTSTSGGPESSGSTSSGSTTTSTPGPGTSATQGQASSTTSAQSSATGTRPVLSILCLTIGLMVITALT